MTILCFTFALMCVANFNANHCCVCPSTRVNRTITGTMIRNSYSWDHIYHLYMWRFPSISFHANQRKASTVTCVCKCVYACFCAWANMCSPICMCMRNYVCVYISLRVYLFEKKKSYRCDGRSPHHLWFVIFILKSAFVAPRAIESMSTSQITNEPEAPIDSSSEVKTTTAIPTPASTASPRWRQCAKSTRIHNTPIAAHQVVTHQHHVTPLPTTLHDTNTCTDMIFLLPTGCGMT